MRPIKHASGFVTSSIAAAFIAGSISVVAPVFADAQADFDGFNEGSPSTIIMEDGITFSNLDMRIPGQDPPYNFVIERADGTLGGEEGFTSPNTLGFGGYAPGEGAAFSRCGEFRISTGQVESAASIEVFQFGAGNGNTITLEAWLGGDLVDSMTVDIDQTFELHHYTLSVTDVEFDELWVVGAGPDNDGCFFAVVDHVVIETGDAGLTMGAPVPGEPNRINTLTASGTTAFSRVYFAYGFRAGMRQLPGCPEVFIDLRSPKVLGSNQADSNGVAEINFFVPGNASGVTVLFQAADPSECLVSNLVEHTF